MIKVQATYIYHCDTDDELNWVISQIPQGFNPVINELDKTVTYIAEQTTEVQ